MGVPVRQQIRVAGYIAKQKLMGRKRYPLVLMLEPLFRCNLACAGCGKIQYPANVLKAQLSVEECLHAADECGAPVVSIPGGEPLLHPEIDRIVDGLVARRKYVYLCTNGLLLEEMGRALLCAPYFASTVLAATAILNAGTEDQKRSQVNHWSSASGSRHASSPSPALRQVCSRNRRASQPCSVATWGSKSPQRSPRAIQRPWRPTTTP